MVQAVTVLLVTALLVTALGQAIRVRATVPPHLPTILTIPTILITPTTITITAARTILT